MHRMTTNRSVLFCSALFICLFCSALFVCFLRLVLNSKCRFASNPTIHCTAPHRTALHWIRLGALPANRFHPWWMPWPDNTPKSSLSRSMSIRFPPSRWFWEYGRCPPFFSSRKETKSDPLWVPMWHSSRRESPTMVTSGGFVRLVPFNK